MRTCKRCAEPIPTADRRAKFCGDHCRKRFNDEEIVAWCSECGAGINRHNARHMKGTRCGDCYLIAKRRAREARASIIADLWEDGLTVWEIAAEFGWTKNATGVEIARIRAEFPGLLPHRRSPEAVANIRAGWAAAREKRLAA